MRLFKVIFIAFFYIPAYLAQNQISDSLHKLLSTTKQDSSKYNIFFAIGVSYKNVNWDSARAYFNKAAAKAKVMKDELKLAETIRQIGWSYYQNAEFSVALKEFNEVISLIEPYMKAGNLIHQQKSKKIYTAVLNNIGAVYEDMANYPQALDSYFKSLKVAEEINDRNKTASVLGNIGSLYKNQNNYVRALDYFFKSLKLAELLNDEKLQANALGNIGTVYKAQAEEFSNISEKTVYYNKALDFYYQALGMAEKSGNRTNHATNLGNIGNVFSGQAEIQENKMQRLAYLNKSIDYHLKAYKITEELGSKSGSARHMGNIGTVYSKLGKFNEAQKFLEKALFINKSIGALNLIKENQKALFQLFDTTGKHQLALHYYQDYIASRDSINNKENEKKQYTLEMTNKFEKQQAADSVRNAERMVQEQIKHEQEIKLQRNFTYGGIVGFILMMIIAFTSFRAFKQKQKSNFIITRQKHIVEEKQKEILDSIHYAQRIQQAILPNEKEWMQIMPESFVLYLPKDIVAGDFYWMESLTGKTDDVLLNNAIMFAAADCTGHGVPGAMVSVICSNALSKSVLEDKMYDPAKILDRTREIVIEKLSKSNTEVKDGMDISLCCLIEHTLIWAGANNPLWLIQDNGKKLTEVKADKQPIGKYSEIKPFTSHKFSLQKGDIIYSFTDGFADQFGGPRGKKFKYKQLEEILLGISSQPMDIQKQILHSKFNEWKGSLEQVDDVCIIGVRI